MDLLPGQTQPPKKKKRPVSKKKTDGVNVHKPIRFEEQLKEFRFTKRFPRELKDYDQWCLHDAWKRPVNVACLSEKYRGFSEPGNPKTWACYQDAVIEAKKYNWGLGFHLSESDPFCVLDLDHVRNAKTGEHLAPWVDTVLNHLDTLTYLSLSGTGYHIFTKVTGGLKGPGLQASNLHGETGIDIYDRNHFFAMSGKVYKRKPIRDCTDKVLQIYAWAAKKLEAKKAKARKEKDKIRTKSRGKRKKRFMDLNLKSGEGISLSDWLMWHGVRVTPFEWSGITMYGFDECPWISGHTSPSKALEAKVFESSKGPWAFSCFHSHCNSYGWEDVREYIGCTHANLCTNCKKRIEEYERK